MCMAGMITHKLHAIRGTAKPAVTSMVKHSSMWGVAGRGDVRYGRAC